VPPFHWQHLTGKVSGAHDWPRQLTVDPLLPISFAPAAQMLSHSAVTYRFGKSSRIGSSHNRCFFEPLAHAVPKPAIARSAGQQARFRFLLQPTPVPHASERPCARLPWLRSRLPRGNRRRRSGKRRLSHGPQAPCLRHCGPVCVSLHGRSSTGPSSLAPRANQVAGIH
jgi:hypothetical protein